MRKNHRVGGIVLACLLAAAFPVSASGPSCAELPGLAPLLAPGTVLLFGEMHGTEQAPAFVGEVVCAGLAAGLPVTVGLEIPRADDEAYQTYLRSEGSAEDRARLLASPFWDGKWKDGRSSRAMLDLVESLRELAAREGADLDLILIDRPAAADRDAAMAERVGEALAASPRDLFVVLTGNLHNRLTRGTSWNPELEPMGHRLRRAHPGTRIVSLNMSYPGGTAWACFGSQPEDCGVQEIGGPESAAGRRGVELEASAEEAPYDGRWFTGRVTASPPAIGAPEATAGSPAPDALDAFDQGTEGVEDER